MPTPLLTELADGAGVVLLADVAARLGISIATARRWAAQGVPTDDGPVRLEAVRIGRAWRTSEASLARFLKRLEAA